MRGHSKQYFACHFTFAPIDSNGNVMAQLGSKFNVSDLPSKIQYYEKDYKLRKRKQQGLSLKECDLFELVQYNCDPLEKRIKKETTAPIECEPVVRLFRR